MFNIDRLEIDADADEMGMNSFSMQTTLESYMGVLRAHQDNKVLTMAGLENSKYKGDLAGWLLFKGVKEKYHWTIARVNQLTTCYDYDGVKTTFIIPSMTYMDELLSRHKTKNI